MRRAFLHKIKKKQILFFFLKAILFLLLVIMIDVAIGNILSYYYFKQESGLQYRSTYSIEKTTAEILVFGSSRANHHYKPEVIEKELNLTYYNVGRDGSSILYHKAVLNAIKNRYLPKIIILDINEGEFKQNPTSYERMSSLLPYYKKHPEMRKIIELRSEYEKYKLYSSIYPYNSVISTIAIGNTEMNKKRKGDYLGYIPLNKTWNEEIKANNNSTKYEIDYLKLKMFESFIMECKQANINLYVVFSPFFVKFRNHDYSVELAKQMAHKYEIPFFDYTNNVDYFDNNLFADFGHLNDKGAIVFTNELTKRIKKSYITEPNN